MGERGAERTPKEASVVGVKAEVVLIMVAAAATRMRMERGFILYVGMVKAT